METIPEKLVKTYGKAQPVFSEGSVGKEMYIIYSGKVSLYHSKISGGLKLISTLEPGDFFGEMALVDESPRAATAIADEDGTQLIILDQSKFSYLIRQQPDFALVVMAKLCERIREANRRLAEITARYAAA